MNVMCSVIDIFLYEKRKPWKTDTTDFSQKPTAIEPEMEITEP